MGNSNSGPPRLYSPELAAKVCERLAIVGSTIRVCAEEGMPSETTLWHWRRDNPEFADNYARAKLQGVKRYEDEILDISDDGKNDWMERHDPQNLGYKANGEHIQRSKLRIETRQWIADRMMPKVTKTAIDMTSSDGSMSPVLDEQSKATRIAQLMELAAKRKKPPETPTDDFSDLV